ncbi:MAG TPA: N,N-dimethylformamidase beta subunit family domain-containing protein [Ilumatobacter sp.]|nr:N,N-dimethylformamidase beta subunit family domain-containing protein [Ilumatobacter sp.]
MADDITHYDSIEGYCNELSYAAGAVAEVCVHTHAASFSVSVERWGSAREPVWAADELAGAAQATPADADASGCGWSVSVEIPVDTAWRTGFYLITLTANHDDDHDDDHDDNQHRNVGYAGFVVTAAPDHAAPTLFVLGTNTWNAYNSWGGRSLYSGGTQVAFRRPWGRGMLVRPEVERDDRKSRPRYTGEEPDADGEIYQAYRFANGYPGFMGSAGWFTHERRFVEWAEGSGYRFDYAVSSDLARLRASGDLTRYRAIVSVGHDEYWSADQREAVEAFVADGGNVASLSGNTMFWQVRPEPAAHGGTTMVCHKYSAHRTDPLAATNPTAMTGMWADPEVARPESNFLGAASLYGLYHRFGQATARGVGGFVVHRDDHWMFADTGLRYGDVLGADFGVVGYETVGCLLGFDHARLPIAVADPALHGSSHPHDTCVVAYTQSSNLGVGEYPKSISALDDQGDLEFIAERIFGGGPAALAKVRHGNSVMLTCRPSGPSGGEVVVVGSTDWVFGLADPAVAQVTRNIMEHVCSEL